MTDTKQPEALRLAHDIGANLIKIEPTERTRTLFEAWMRGHCWQVSGDWNGKQYVHAIEVGGQAIHPPTQNTRQLFAAFRDGLAVQAHQDAARITKLEAENRALKEQHEAVGAGGVTGLRADHFRDAAQKVRFERAKGATAQAMRDNLSDALWQCGDATLIWANEGDLLMLGAAIAQEGGK